MRKQVLRMFCLTLASIMLLSTYATVFATSYIDGTYEGTGSGRNGDIVLNVTVTDGIISGIETVSQEETSSYWDMAVALFDEIISSNSTEVDAVSGATISSNGIIEAVNNALAQAVDFGIFNSGAGTESNPYVIATSDQLVDFAASVDAGESYAGMYIELGADIDISSVEWNPIGTESAATAASTDIFAGTFDGCGYSISGLTLNGEYTADANVGLFSSLNNTAVVKNLNVVDAAIDIDSTMVVRAGIITGYTVSGSVSSAAFIDSCMTSGSVSVNTTGAKLAYGSGIAANVMNYTVISNCQSSADISTVSAGGSNSAYSGGIAATTGVNTAVINCASLGNIYASSPLSTNMGGMAGGIAAMMAGKQWNCYAIGDVTYGNGGSSNNWSGILDGQITITGMSKDTNGEYQYPDEGALRTECYYPLDAALTREVWSSADTLESSTPVSTTAAGSGSTNSDTKYVFTSIDTKVEMMSQDFADTLNESLYLTSKLINSYSDAIAVDIVLKKWTYSDTDNAVVLSSEEFVNDRIDETIFECGSGTEDNPYVIASAEQMKAFAASLTAGIDYSGLYVVLSTDIDISGENWSPVGGSDYAFNGTFDGQGYTISGLTEGSASEALVLDSENVYVGLFGVLGSSAVVKNLNLDDVYINVTYSASAFVGIIAGVTEGGSGYLGSIIDNCSASGELTLVSEAGNTFGGGIVSYQYKGAIINCVSDVDVSVTTKDGSIAESGGLVGLSNRGLIANCYSLGDAYGSANRELEGMASVSTLVGVNGGMLVNSYSYGNNTTDDYSVYVGAVSGWITGIGKAYSCLYNADSVMTVGTQTVNPVESVGTKVSSGVNEDGDAYTGGLVYDIVSYNAETYSSVAEALNANFEAFPTDITQYGVMLNSLKNWVYDQDAGIVKLDDSYQSITYVQPDVEIVEDGDYALNDGIWYGRDADATVVVTISVEKGEISDVLTDGDTYTEDAYKEALEKAEEKSMYGDFTTYGPADTTVFSGGDGSEENPYLIETEKQLRYVAEALNEDVDWENTWFKLENDIVLEDGDWLPIGWGIMAEINGSGTTYCTYPFKGNFDGDNHTVSGMTIGSESESADVFAAGFFGITSGDYSGNDVPDEGTRDVTIKNLNLENISIYNKTRYQTYTGGLLGSGQNGIIVDNCSVTGKIHIETTESFARAGGLASNILRGCVTDSYTNVEIYASTDSSNVYAGGLYGLSNRVTTVNCYALGDVVGNSTNNNKVYVGGLVGQAGGVKINCYALGDVTSEKTTTNVGGLNGRLAGIAVDYDCYYSSTSNQIIAETKNEINVASGVVVSTVDGVDTTIAMTSEELASENFALLLNTNIANMSSILTSAQDILAAATSSASLTHSIYYLGDGSDLNAWTLLNGVVGFDIAETEPTATPTEQPTATPTATPTEQPTATPTEQPTAIPTTQPNYNWSIEGYDNGAITITAPDDTVVGNVYKLIVASYEFDDILVNCEVIDVVIEDGKTVYDITVSEFIDENTKIMLWDNNLAPLTSVYDVSI